VLAVLVPCTALAQSAQPAGGSNNGIKLGSSRVHPYFDLELRFDSAAGFFPRNGVIDGTPQPELLLHLRPGLRLELPSDTVQLDLTGNVDYVYFTGLLTPNSQAASRLEAAADLSAVFNRKGNVSFELGDHFTRSDRTSNAALGVGVYSLFNEARAQLPIRPGGGALEITPKAAVGVEFFAPISLIPVTGCSGDLTCDPAAVEAMNYLNLRAGVLAKWRFFPKTAIVLDTSFDYRSYLSSEAAINPPAQLIKVSAGLAGLLTNKISLIAKAGWGHDFGASLASTLVAHLEFTYLLNEVSSVKAGYLRNLEPVPSFGAYGDDRGYLDASILLSGRLTARGYAAFDYLTFYRASGRADTVFTLNVGPGYEVFSWLVASAGYALTIRGSNQTSIPSVNFTRHEAYLRATVTY
jgi:hypothetical protein